MKRPFPAASRPRIIAVLAAATIPATLFAVDYFYQVSVYDQASIGYNNFGSSNNGVLLIGQYNNPTNNSFFHQRALAVGFSNIIRSNDSAVIGRWNKAARAHYEILILGNGTGSGTLSSNAMEVLTTGRTKLINKEWKKINNPDDSLADLPLADPPAPNDDGGDALVVEGHTRLLGKVVIEQPQGDIPMFGQ